jgi:AAA+ ATPase superfamily predicted ATPase
MDLKLNESQTKAYLNTLKFLESKKQNNMLLLGPAGSGKTTVIVNAFNGKSMKVAFCAFTNKATQVLCKIADKFSIDFNPDFMTIHKLLALEIKYLDKETEIAFTFDKSKIEYLKDYNVIIFDECSTISKELYKYIYEDINIHHRDIFIFITFL